MKIIVKNALILLVTSQCLLIGQVESIGYLESGLAALISILLVPGIGLALAAFGIVTRSRARVLLGAGLVLVAALSLFASSRFIEVQERASKSIGDRLCASIEQYRSLHGTYPADLEELPIEVPSTSMGIFRRFGFHYRPLEASLDFRLSFESANFILCSRTARGPWHCDD